MRAQLIRINEEPVEITPENGTDFKLQELYSLLECKTIQAIALFDGRFMIMDEEGKYNSELNPAATRMANNVIMHNDWIAGHVIVCDESCLQ